MDATDKSGDIEALFRQEYENLYLYAYSMVNCREDAIDAVQEAFLRFHSLRAEAKVRANPRALLFRLGRNCAIDMVRRAQTRGSYESAVCAGNLIPFQPPAPQSPEEIMLQRERRHCADRAFARLSERERECLELRGFGLSYHEVAAVLKLSPNAIGPMIGRALKRFRHSYDELLEKQAPPSRAGSGRR